MSGLPLIMKTISVESEFKIKEKGSLFIGLSLPVNYEEEAINLLNSTKKKYYDATHHCFSYKLAEGLFKYSDDGEPSGTAGIRIYNAQNHYELSNLITIVVRYFGGTKLGVGPLGKAYYEAALQNLDASTIVTKELHQEITFEYKFEQTKFIHHLVNKYNLIIKNTQYESNPSMQCSIKTARLSDMLIELKEGNNPDLRLSVSENSYYL